VCLSLCVYVYLAFLCICILRKPRLIQGCSAVRMDGWIISVYSFVVCLFICSVFVLVSVCYVLSFVFAFMSTCSVLSSSLFIYKVYLFACMCLYVVFCLRPCLYVGSICLYLSICSVLSSSLFICRVYLPLFVYM
jgi:hypothetical protein